MIRGRGAYDELGRLRRRIAGDPELDLGPSRRAPPRRQGRPPQLGGEHSLDPTLGPGDELQHHVRDGTRTGEGLGLGFRGAGGVGEGPAEAVEGFAVRGGDLGEERLRISGAIARRPTRHPDRGAATHQTVQGPVGVGAGETNGAGHRVTRGRAEAEQGAVNHGLCGGEPKGHKIGRHSSSPSYYFPLSATTTGPL